jgi:2-oxoglutarate dehydrogenase complex dihydrolipoamide succinyltransferase (E2) component
MEYKVVVPPLGESVVEGTIVKWLKNEGDSIKVDDPLVEIMTDKINVEIPSPYAGKMKKHLVKPDTVVEIGQEIAVVEVEGEAAEAKTFQDKPVSGEERIPQEQDVAEAPKEFTWITEHHEKMGIHADKEAIEGGIKAVRSSPVVRRLAREHFIDLRMVHGTGRDGRVSKEDVIQYINSRHAVDKKKPDFAWPDQEQEEVIPISGVRKVIAEHMVKSAFTIPHVTTFDECDMSRLIAWRKQNVDKIEQEHGVRITFLPFIAKAMIFAAKDFPWINATVEDGALHVKKYFHIGMAVARENSLIVPVIKHCEQKSILQIAKDMKDLGDKANADKLKIEEITGGTISITNAGVLGALSSTPIIAHPQVAILGVHKIVKRPVAVDDEVVIRPIMNFGLSFDHRVVDGGYAVQFLRKMIEHLENIDSWLIGVI